jgi:excisionase family DNA binding protein
MIIQCKNSQVWLCDTEEAAEHGQIVRASFGQPQIDEHPEPRTGQRQALPANSAKKTTRPKAEQVEQTDRMQLKKASRTFDADLLKVQELYTLPEVAALLSVGLRTVEDLVKNGDLASGIVTGTERARRVSRAQIVAYIEAFNLQNGLNRTYRKSPRRSRARA